MCESIGTTFEHKNRHDGQTLDGWAIGIEYAIRIP